MKSGRQGRGRANVRTRSQRTTGISLKKVERKGKVVKGGAEYWTSQMSIIRSSFKGNHEAKKEKLKKSKGKKARKKKKPRKKPNLSSASLPKRGTKLILKKKV